MDDILDEMYDEDDSENMNDIVDDMYDETDSENDSSDEMYAEK